MSKSALDYTNTTIGNGDVPHKEVYWPVFVREARLNKNYFNFNYTPSLLVMQAASAT